MTAAQVRALIASATVGEGDDAPDHIGDIVLHAHQRDAIVRLERGLERFGVVLLADEVGLGKTYTALAVARDAQRLAIVAPAGLVPMWRRALAAAGRDVPVLSMERLGAPNPPALPPACDLVIIDEAHHARNPGARRYERLAALTRGAHVLLISATPIHNRGDDLTAVLALGMGERAAALSADDLAHCVVRRTRHALGDRAPTTPAIAPPVWLELEHDAAMLDALAAIPSAIPPRDGGDGGALVVFGLVRQWASSDGALRAALRRRLARADALATALDAGRHPTREELAAWTIGDDAIQLAFAELLSVPTACGSFGALRAGVARHAEGIRRALDTMSRSPNHDLERVTRLRELRANHPNERIVAFSQFDQTVTALYRLIAGDGRVSALTAAGGRVAGGRLSRVEVLARFAPRASLAPAPPAAEVIDLLLTTDLLSEGVNLHDASVVVHLDLPWTAARLEQRVGRVRRIGSRHDRVAVYAMAPPASAEALLAVEQRLLHKARVGGASIGAMEVALPSVVGADAVPTASTADIAEQIHQMLRGWRGNLDQLSGVPAIATIGADTLGALALVMDANGEHQLVAWHARGSPTVDPLAVLGAITRATSGADIEPNATHVRQAHRAIDRWCRARSGELAAGTQSPVSREARAFLARMARTISRAPPHLRPGLASLAARARATALAMRGRGAERLLGRLAKSIEADRLWLQHLKDALEDVSHRPAETHPVRIAAMVVFHPRE
jgi:superfamily II DNA or RNA helicase